MTNTRASVYIHIYPLYRTLDVGIIDREKRRDITEAMASGGSTSFSNSNSNKILVSEVSVFFPFFLKFGSKKKKREGLLVFDVCLHIIIVACRKRAGKTSSHT